MKLSMNVTELIKSNEGYRKTYFQKIKDLENQGKFFSDYTKQIVANAKKQQKADMKKRRKTGEMVTGATGKDRIRKLKQILIRKIAEINSGSDDEKMKNIMISNINLKLAALDRILSQIERKEAEAVRERSGVQMKARVHKKRRNIEKVYLTKDELTLKDDKNPWGACGEPAALRLDLGGQVDITSCAEDIVAEEPPESASVNICV